MNGSVAKIPLNSLLAHEEFNEDHVCELVEWLKRDGYQLRPIAVFDLRDFDVTEKFLILDGHHRTEALKRLGYRFIMSNSIDYLDTRFKVLSWQDGREYDKLEIIRVALNRQKLKPKTTKHAIQVSANLIPFQDNDLIEPKIFARLEELK